MPEPTLRELELSGQLARALGQLEQTQAENKLLREKIDALLRRLFGAKSEQIDPGQLLLMLQGLEAPPKAPEPVALEAPRRSTAPSSPPRERGPRLPEHLEVVEEIIEPELVQASPQAWRCRRS